MQDVLVRNDGSSAVEVQEDGVRADQVDASGKVLARVEMPFSRAELPKAGEAKAITVQPGTHELVLENSGSASTCVRCSKEPGGAKGKGAR